MGDINEMAKIMTREDFMIEIEGHCPKEFGLNNDECAQVDNCLICRENTIKDIIFKGEENISNNDLQNNNYTWVFNLEEFKDNDVCITCKSKPEAEQFINILIINGITNWIDGEELKIENTYCDSSITYSFDTEEKGGLCFSQELDYFLGNNYIILEFSKVDFSQVWNKESIAEVALNNESKNDINYKEEYYNLKNNELINEIDKREHKKYNETILSQYSEIQELKQMIDKLKSDLEVYEVPDEKYTVDKIKKLEKENKTMESKLLEYEDELLHQKNIIKEQNEEIHNLDSIIKDLQTEKKTLKTQVESANNRCESIAKLNQQFRQIIKQFSEML